MTGSTMRIPDQVVSLASFVDSGVLAAVDVHLAAWVVGSMGVDHPHVAYAVAMASWAARNGHSCADLDRIAGVVDKEMAVHSVDEQSAPPLLLDWPVADAVLHTLRASSEMVRVVDGWDSAPQLDARPLVVFGRRVYLQRHWVDECTIAASLRQRSSGLQYTLSPKASVLLDALLPATLDGEANLQRSAAEMVLGNRLAIVVGGPGTGKTYSVARLLAVLIDQASSGGRALHVGLAAPTGKAAQRLRDSILASLQLHDANAVDPIPGNVRAVLDGLIPTTIHRLLGSSPGVRQRFRHDADNPLPHDVIVIDETSMVSSPLLARLIEAVRPNARLLLIGDPDQLESVELGAVLEDLVEAGTNSSAAGPLVGRVARLTRGHRFAKHSPIAIFADAVRDGNGDAAMACLRGAAPLDASGSGLRYIETDDPTEHGVAVEIEQIVKPLLQQVREHAEAGDAKGALSAMLQARILCAHREGRFGVATWNHFGERWLCGAAGAPALWYVGRPLLVSRNDARLGLANGDSGVVIRSDGRLLAAFPGHDELFETVQLEDVHTAYAMTVHKSQGSEYDSVVMIFPPATSPLVGRELVYTGVTRARNTLHVVGSEAAVRLSVATPAYRMTGLADALLV